MNRKRFATAALCRDCFTMPRADNRIPEPIARVVQRVAFPIGWNCWEPLFSRVRTLCEIVTQIETEAVKSLLTTRANGFDSGCYQQISCRSSATQVSGKIRTASATCSGSSHVR